MGKTKKVAEWGHNFLQTAGRVSNGTYFKRRVYTEALLISDENMVHEWYADGTRMVRGWYTDTRVVHRWDDKKYPNS